MLFRIRISFRKDMITTSLKLAVLVLTICLAGNAYSAGAPAAAAAAATEGQPPQQPYDYTQQVPNSRYFSIAFIDKAKRLVFVNAGEAHGINKGDRVCILDQYRVKIGCFRIRILNSTSAGFKPSKKKFIKLNSGMVARFAEDDEQLDEDYEDIKASYVEMGLIISGLTPHVYNRVAYEQDKDNPNALKLVADVPERTNFTELYLGSQVQFKATLGYAMGLITRIYPPIEYESDLGESFPNLRAVHQYNVVGVGVPFVIRWFYGKGNSQLMLSEGLQWDISYLKYRLYSKDNSDEKTMLLQHLSVLNTLSIRAEVGGSFKVGKESRINTGLGIIVPVAKFGSGRATEFEGGGGGDATDVEEALGHDKAKIGIDIGFSFLLGF